jgi:hypothetical protein
MPYACPLGEVEEARKVLEGGLEHDAGHYSLNYNYAKMLLDLDRTGLIYICVCIYIYANILVN